MPYARPAPAGLVARTEVVSADQRFVTRTPWLESRHSFSYGPHYDPANTHHGLLVANNDDIVQAGHGFDPHPHRDTEIVTWVLDGSLVHEDSDGSAGLIYPGLAQRMSAGRGIVHSERNDSWRRTGGPEHADPVHYVQMWVMPDEVSIDPGYAQSDIGDRLVEPRLVPMVSGRRADAPVTIRQRHATLHVARLGGGDAVTLPPAPYLHLLVARGAVELEGVGTLEQGDAARITASDGQGVAALRAAELLVWEMHATLG